MFSVNTGRLLSMANALVTDRDPNPIGAMLERAVQRAGEQLIEQVVSATPLGEVFNIADRLVEGLQTGGESEVRRMSRRWIGAMRRGMPGPARQASRLVGRMQTNLQRAIDVKYPRRKPLWQRTGWAMSRQQWLNESWMHDWRSQPRRPAGTDEGGEWMAGRLPYPVGKVGHLTTSRRKRYVRRVKAKRRAAGRKIAREIISSWNDDHGA